MRRFIIMFCGAVLLSAFTAGVRVWALDTEKLSEDDAVTVREIVRKLSPLVKERRRRGDLVRLTFEELYAPLSLKEQKLLKAFRKIDAEKLGVKIPFRGLATGKEALVAVRGQAIYAYGRKTIQELPVQYVPPHVYKKYTAMMDAMHKEIGRRLYIQSAYRSSAYQLYLFINYLREQGYSIRKTSRRSALPGYSEHGWPKHQALDLVSLEGIGSSYRTDEFSDLPEYRWLLKNARKFGFVLSYPENSSQGIDFEPWHWRWDG